MVFDGASGMSLDNLFEPFASEFAGLHVLVLASAVDVLHDAHVIGDMTDDGKDGVIGVGASDWLCVGAELDEVLEQDLDHAVNTRAVFFGKILEEETTVG